MRKLAAVLLAVACAGPVSAQEMTRFEALYRSGKKIQGAATSGVSLIRLNALLEELSAEVSIGKDRAATDKERELVAAFGEAYDAYAANREIWKRKINMEGIFGDKLPCVGECENALKKYDLAKLLEDHGPERDAELRAKAKGKPIKEAGPYYYASDVMLAMWKVADNRIVMASAMYMGKKPEALKP